MAILLVALMGAAALACTSGGGRPGSALPLPPEVEAGAAFMRGRYLELEGQFSEAAEAYERAASSDPNAPLLRIYLARVWARLGDNERALLHAERAHELQPEDEEVVQMMVSLYVALKRYEEAAALLEPTFEAGELSGKGLQGLFDLYLQVNDLEAAERVAREMIVRTPVSLAGYLALGVALERAEQLEDAEAAYRRGLEIAPAHVAPFEAIARIRAKQGDTQGELAVLREKLGTHPGDTAALLRMAQIHEAEGNRERSMQLLEELIEAHPQHKGAQFQLGFFYYQTQQPAEAIALFEKIIEGINERVESPLRDEVTYFLGLAYHEAHQPEAALEALDRIPMHAERFGNSRVLAARILEEKNQIAEALNEVRRAIQNDPENTALRVTKAGLMQRSGDFKGAVSTLQDLIDIHPEDANLRYDMGLTYAEAGDDEGVLTSMQEAVDLDPNHAGALNYIGYTWAEKGERLDEAEALIRRAVALRPGDGYITDSLGWVLYQRGLQLLASGQASEARQALMDAIDHLEQSAELLDGDDPIIRRHLGDAYRSVSRFTDALASYRRALELDPKDSVAEEIRREIELLELQLEGASSGARP